MYPDNVVKTQILRRWVELVGLVDLLEYLEFYVSENIITRPSDIYKLTLRNLYVNPELSEAEAHKILEAIHQTDSITLARVLSALLPDLSLSDVRDVVLSSLSIEQIFEKAQCSIFSEYLPEEVSRLEQLNIDLLLGDDDIFRVLDVTPFTGKKVSIAGVLSAPNSIVVDSLNSLGAEVMDALYSDNDYLVIGEGAAKEALKAGELGVQVLTEDDVASMLGM